MSVCNATLQPSGFEWKRPRNSTYNTNMVFCARNSEQQAPEVDAANGGQRGPSSMASAARRAVGTTAAASDNGGASAGPGLAAQRASRAATEATGRTTRSMSRQARAGAPGDTGGSEGAPPRGLKRRAPSAPRTHPAKRKRDELFQPTAAKNKRARAGRSASRTTPPSGDEGAAAVAGTTTRGTKKARGDEGGGAEQAESSAAGALAPGAAEGVAGADGAAEAEAPGAPAGDPAGAVAAVPPAATPPAAAPPGPVVSSKKYTAPPNDKFDIGCIILWVESNLVYCSASGPYSFFSLARFCLSLCVSILFAPRYSSDCRADTRFVFLL